MHAHHQAHGAGFASPESPYTPPDDLAPLGAAAAAPGGVGTAPNDEAPGVMAEGFRDQERVDSLHSAAADIVRQDKAFTTARAKLALAGWTMQIVDGGNGAAAFLVSRWGHSRTLADWHALAQFMRQVGCKQ